VQGRRRGGEGRKREEGRGEEEGPAAGGQPWLPAAAAVW